MKEKFKLIINVIKHSLRIVRYVFASMFIFASLYWLINKNIFDFIFILILSGLLLTPELIALLRKKKCKEIEEKATEIEEKPVDIVEETVAETEKTKEAKERIEKIQRIKEIKEWNRKRNEELGGLKEKFEELNDYINNKDLPLDLSNMGVLSYEDEHGYFLCSIEKDELIKIMKKSKLDIPKLAMYLQEKMEVAIEAKKIEKEEIKRQYKLKIREQAEKLVYCKADNKKKREPIKESDKELIFEKFGNKCSVCGKEEGLHIHHKDNNPKNNKISNLILLCGVCHKKIHMKVR